MWCDINCGKGDELLIIPWELQHVSYQRVTAALAHVTTIHAIDRQLSQIYWGSSSSSDWATITSAFSTFIFSPHTHTWWHAMNVLKYVSSCLFASSECPVLSSIIWTVVNIDSLPTYCHISDYCLPLANMFTNNINTYHQPLSLSCSSSPVKFYTPSSTGQTRELFQIIHFYR